MIQNLLLILVVSIPFYGVGVIIGMSYVSTSHLICFAISAILALSIMARKLTIKKWFTRWSTPFIAFISFNLVGLLLSPYGSQIYNKGIVQILGITGMVSMGYVLIISIDKNPDLLLKIVKFGSYAIGFLAIIGIAQFIIWNFTPNKTILTFNFLNNVSGGNVWQSPGKTGPLFRINSFAVEPSHFCRYLGFSLGWAFLRLGVYGNTVRAYMKNIMPLWVAISVIIAFLLSFSLIGYLQFIFVMITLMFFVKKGKKLTRNNVIIIGLSFLFLSIVAIITGGSLLTKLRTVLVIFSANRDIIQGSLYWSASAIAINMLVAVKSFLSSPLLGSGLGSHPISYSIYAPAHDLYNLSKFDLNKDDAASLFLRLFSETGIIGTILFVGGIFWLLFRARRAINQCISLKINHGVTTIILSIGIISSAVGLIMIYLIRSGQYFDPIFWLVISLTASIPLQLKNKFCQ